MVKKSYSITEQLDLQDVVDCVKGHLERAGYEVTVLHNYGVGVALKGVKGKVSFVVEAVGGGEGVSSAGARAEEALLYAVGEVVQRMKERAAWTFYGVAFPRGYLKFMKNFEVGGIRLLDFHFFIVENVWSLYHLDTKAMIELIEDLKADKPERLIDLDIDFKDYDFNI
jgi:hypothetical protein